MPLGPSEVIVCSGPKNTNGVRNQFIDVHLEMLRDANIPARIATLSDVGPEHKPRWAEEQGDWEPLFIVVPEDRRAEALQVNQTIETGTVRICVQCEACIKPGATKCPRCGVSDERDPAQLRIEYDAWLQKHLAGK
jgi:ribosomal protein L40E